MLHLQLILDVTKFYPCEYVSSLQPLADIKRKENSEQYENCDCADIDIVSYLNWHIVEAGSVGIKFSWLSVSLSSWAVILQLYKME